MNRVDFMKQLESLLQNISPEERAEALQYYEDYFNDAGKENESAVIEALGNPAKVAENIKRDLYGAGYGGTSYQKSSSEKALVEYHGTPESSPKKESMSTGTIILIVLLCILASPVIGGLLGGLLSIVAAWFAIILGFGAAAVVLLVVMLVLFVVGIMCIWEAPLVSVAVIGSGMVCGGIGILFLMLTVAMAGIATPAIFKGIVGLCKKIFGSKE